MTVLGRWRTLLSVDDMVAGLVERLDTEQILENTYIIYTRSHWVTPIHNPQCTNPQTTITKSTIPKPKSTIYYNLQPIIHNLQFSIHNLQP